MAHTFPSRAASTPWRPFILAILSAGVGIGATLAIRSHVAPLLEPSGDADFRYWIFIVSFVTVFSLFFGAIERRGIVYRPLIMTFSHYFSGIVFLSWGQLLPFELTFVPVLAAPGAFAGYVGTLLTRR